MSTTVSQVGTKRAVGYFRVSTQDQAGDGHGSLETQEAHFQEFCEREGYDVVGTYTDVVSGRRDDRTEYLRMVDFALNGGTDVVVVQFLDRFGRNPFEIVSRVSELRGAGVSLVATDQNIDDELILFVTAAMAGAESKRNSQRVRATMARAVAKGVHAARAPYGLRRVRALEGESDKVKVTWELHPEQADAIRSMYLLAVEQNYGYKRIADAMTAQGIRASTDRPFSSFTIERILTNPAIKGDLVYGRRPRKGNPEAEIITNKGFFPAIITAEEWERLEQRRRIRAENSRGRTHASVYLLSGIARCGHCGGPMVGKAGALRKAKKAAPGERYRNYYCTHAMHSRGQCEFYNGHSVAKLERAVMEYLGQFSDPKLVREKLEAMKASTVRRKVKELEKLRKQLGQLDDAVLRDLDRLDRGVLTEDEYVRVSAKRREDTDRLRPREAELRQDVERANEQAEAASRIPEVIGSFLEDVETLDIGRRKAWLQTILKAAHVWNDGRVELEFRV